MSKNTLFPGALIDDRPEEEKIKDYKFEEIVASADKVDWQEKPESRWRKFPISDQDGSGSCVAQTLVKLMGVILSLLYPNDPFVLPSATHLYQRRKNRPNGGMIGADAFNIAKNEGVTLEDLVPSQNMNDREMDTAPVEKYKKLVGAVFKIGNFVFFPTKDIDKIASTIQKTDKAVMVWFHFKRDEWGSVAKVKYKNLPASGSGIVRHSVAAVDFFMYKGEKCLLIEDSWGPDRGKGGRRIIPESFFKERNIFAAYAINFQFEDETQPSPLPSPDKPKFTFDRTLEFSPTYKTDSNVVFLQKILKYEGLFPKNVDCTGYYGAITAKAVYQWQIKHNVASRAELDALQGRIVGPKTINALNALYSK